MVLSQTVATRADGVRSQEQQMNPRTKISCLLLAILTLAAPALTVTVTVAPAQAAVSSERAGSWESKVVRIVNHKRAARGLAPLRHVSRGCTDRFAERWAWRLADTSTFKHQDMKKVLKRCKSSWVGENLIRGHDLSPTEAVRAWMKSPGHRAVFMAPRAHLGGVGAWVSSDGMTYASAVLSRSL